MASEGTHEVLDGVSYANAPAAVVVDFRANTTVPIAADGNDTVTGFSGGIRIYRLAARRHDQGHQRRRRLRRAWR